MNDEAGQIGNRRQRGITAFHAGLAAEDIAARHYSTRGLVPAAMRWRGKSGEIDLIFRDGDGLIFVEVKRGKTIERAAERLGHRQIERIFRAATEFVANEPLGELTEMQFDLALVDDRGVLEVRENALAA